MRLSQKSLILLAALVCGASAAANTRGSLRRRLNQKHQLDLLSSPETLLSSPEKKLHTEFLRKGDADKNDVKVKPEKKEKSDNMEFQRKGDAEKNDVKVKAEKKEKSDNTEFLRKGDADKNDVKVKTEKREKSDKTKIIESEDRDVEKAPAPTKAPSIPKGSPPSPTPKNDRAKAPKGSPSSPTIKGDNNKAPKGSPPSPLTKVDRTKAPSIAEGSPPSPTPKGDNNKAPKGSPSSSTPKGDNNKAPKGSPSSPTTKGDKTKGKTSKGNESGGSGGKTNKGDKGKKGGDNGKKGGTSSEVTGDGDGDEVVSDTSFLDEAKIEERSLTVAAFEYTTMSTEKPGKQDFEELARVTAEVFDEMYESFFDKIPEMNYGFMELHSYITLTPLLVEFKISSYFHRPSIIPSLTEVEDATSSGFANGAEFYDLYLARLQEMKSNVFSSTTSFRFINTLDGLKEAQQRTSSESHGSWWNENIVKVVVPAATGLVAFFLCICCVRHYREHRRPLTFEELTELEAKPGSRDARSVSSSTYASDSRTSVFSDHTSDKDAALDPKLPMSEVRELSLEEELAQIMSELEESSLGDHNEAGVNDSWEPNKFLATGLASPAEERKESAGGALSQLLSVDANVSKKVEATSSQPAVSAHVYRNYLPTLANAASKDETVVSKPAASPNGKEKPEWMTKKLKSVAKPPAFLEVTAMVETTTSKQESSSSAPQEPPSVSKEEAITEKTVAPTELVAKDESVVQQPAASPDEERKPAWMTKKLRPIATTPTINVAQPDPSFY